MSGLFGGRGSLFGGRSCSLFSCGLFGGRSSFLGGRGSLLFRSGGSSLLSRSGLLL